jgi:SAM-dependent MidA family methyltransferase
VKVGSFLFKHQVEECVNFSHKKSSVFLVALVAESKAYCKQLNALGEIIGAEIRVGGPVSFGRFMELALFHPALGYYERSSSTVGRRGDFYTSVSVGSLFGELLAFQFVDWLDETAGAGPFQLVEAGAHDGKLARDLLTWIRQLRPAHFEKIEYWIIEPSLRRRQWQSETLAEFVGVRWFADWRDLPEGVTGVIFANELLDSFPVRRFAWDAAWKQWFEWGVALDSDQLVGARISLEGNVLPPDCGVPASELESVLPDGYIIEHCPSAAAWWRNAADVLQRGHLLTLDYGLTKDELLVPERINGTLRGYRNHRPVDDVLRDPGEQDLTAHVNFTLLEAAGEAEGLTTGELVSQSRFLSKIAQRAMLPDAHFGEWTAGRVRQFQTLTHPEHLGHAFRVFGQRR